MKRFLACLLTLALLLGTLPAALGEAVETPAVQAASTPEPVKEAEPDPQPDPEPNATEAPIEAPAEAPTEAPAAKEEPVVTEAPAATEEPAVTEAPAAEPEITPEPEVTEAPAPEPAREIAVSISAEPVADGCAEIVAAVEKNFDATVSYDWQTLDLNDPEAEWTSLDRHDSALRLTKLTPELCAATRYRCAVSAEELTALSNELMLDAGQPADEAADFEYTIADGACTITKYTGSAAEVVIPETIEGVPVTAIGDSAFKGCGSLTSVRIPDSVTSIGYSAFYECTGLTSINIPDGVTSIESRAFFRCSSLTSVRIPDSVTSIGSQAFYECTGLTSISIPDGITGIDAYTFFRCSSLASVRIPDSVTGFGEGAFYECAGLTSINIPNGVTSISDFAFYSCMRLTSISIPDSVTSIGESAFQWCSSLTSVDIPDGVASIASSAFRCCKSLTSIRIPDSVTSIDDDAFNGCSSLASISIPNSVTSIAPCTFRACSSLTSINIPTGVTEIGSEAFADCSSLASVNIPEGVHAMGEGVFLRCGSLTDVTIPEGVTHIGGKTFSDCSGLRRVVLPSKLERVDSDAFARCDADVYISDLAAWLQIKFANRRSTPIGKIYLNGEVLTDVVVPEGVVRLGDYVFARCASLRSITIPDSVTDIGKEIVAEDVEIICSAGSAAAAWAASRTYSDYEYEINEDEGYSTITRYVGRDASVVIPSEIGGMPVLEIGQKAFLGETGLVRIELPDSVTRIGVSAFSGCEKLESVKLAEGLKEIGVEAFAGCRSLKSIDLPESLEGINDAAFAGCSSLKSIRLPWGVKWIDGGAIPENILVQCYAGTVAEAYAQGYGNPIEYLVDALVDYEYTIEDGKCTITKYIGSATNADIPAKTIKGVPVTAIGDSAFRDCSSLTGITIPDSVTNIGDAAFFGCISLTGINIPDGVTSIESYTFYKCKRLTNISIPDSVTSIGVEAFAECKSLMNISIPDSVTSIDDAAFSGCSSLTSIRIPKGITEISGGGAFCIPGTFRDCSSLMSIIIPDGVTRIGDGAFSGCSILTSINIPDGVTSIGKGAFSGCSILTSISIPDSVTSIGDAAFAGCSSLTSIRIPKGITEISGGGAFCIPGTFRDCSSLMSIIIPDGVTRIGDGAFSGCSILTSINIPDGVTSIGKGAFSGCSILTSISIPDSVTSIGDSAFSGCSALTGIVIPEGVVEINNEAFKDCSSMESIELPESLYGINDAAFAGCSSLKVIKLPAGMSWIDGNAIPKDTLVQCEAGSYAETWCKQRGHKYRIGDAIDVASLSLNPSALCLGKGQKVDTLHVTVLPEDATNRALIWESSNEAVAKVDADGTITCVAAKGTAIITARTTDGSDLSASCKVTAQARGATGIAISGTSERNAVIRKSTTLKAQLSGKPTNKTVKWESSDPSIATVSSKGVVKGVALGTVTITATAASGYQAQCTVKVINQPVTSIKLSKTKASVLLQSRTLKLKATVAPKNAYDKTLIWMSDAPEIATVDENGVVTVHAAGTATITAAARDGSGKTASCKVTVIRRAVTSIKLNTKKATVLHNRSLKLKATVAPKDAYDKALIWTSSAPEIAAVDENGVVTALKPGTAVITATSKDSGKVAACNVTVKKNAVTKVKLTYNGATKTKLTLNFENEKGKLNTGFAGAVTPADATVTGVRWISSRPDVVTIDEASGAFEVKGVGKATISCIAIDNAKKKATCAITVSKTAVRSVTAYHNGEALTKKTVLQLAVGAEDSGLTAAVLPENATYPGVTWKSSNAKIVKIDSATGAMTALKKGTVTITCTSKDNKKATATFKVKVS